MKFELMRMYNEDCTEKDPFMRKIRLAFCLVMAEDRKLLEELAKQ